MKYKSSAQKTARTGKRRSDQGGSAGPRGAALAPPAYGIDTVDRQAGETGLPPTLKAGLETLSGLAMDDVNVHYNSAKPARLQAQAYTQGRDIYVGPGQEKQLPHEAWHVVQQKQGRVQQTRQTNGLAINDDKSLEKEADVMGTKVNAVPSRTRPDTKQAPQAGSRQVDQQIQSGSSPVQFAKLTFESVNFNTGITGQFDVDTSDPNYAKPSSAGFEMTGTVGARGGTDAEARRWQAGTIQTMTTSTLTNTYKSMDGKTTWNQVYDIDGAIRDGTTGQIPWYEEPDTERFTATNQNRNTELDDAPEEPIAWNGKDGSRLFRSNGLDKFVMWQIALKDGDPNNPWYLNYQKWDYDWSVTYNYATTGEKTVAAKNGGTRLGASGVGKGDVTPKLKDPVANDKANRAIHTKWVKG